MLLLTTLALGQNAAVSQVHCSRTMVVGGDVLWYCFNALASYQRVNAIAAFGDADNAAIFLQAVGALREVSVEATILSPKDKCFAHRLRSCSVSVTHDYTSRTRGGVPGSLPAKQGGPPQGLQDRSDRS